jgi:hypothetical protein
VALSSSKRMWCHNPLFLEGPGIYLGFLEEIRIEEGKEIHQILIKQLKIFQKYILLS